MTQAKIELGKLTVYPHAPQEAGGAGGGVPVVLIFPGGGYARHAPHEEHPVVEWALSLGFAAAVVKYAVAPECTLKAGEERPQSLTDALDAVRTLRRRANEWGLNGKVAVLGFSAGGHAAATLCVRGCDDPETRPDAAVLVYPVITMLPPLAHEGSTENLLGKSPPAELRQAWSCERQVTARTPPAFVVHGVPDTAVPVENAMLYASALRANGVPFELHVYPKGPHGFGMGTEGRLPEGTPIAEWPRMAGVWLKGALG